jgi:arabinan endo-1,5-alpha-L-arabinosidase
LHLPGLVEVSHAYDTKADGASTLRNEQLGWTEDGWPVAL